MSSSEDWIFTPRKSWGKINRKEILEGKKTPHVKENKGKSENDLPQYSLNGVRTSTALKLNARTVTRSEED